MSSLFTSRGDFSRKIMILKPKEDSQIPLLQDYGIDILTGFMPNPPPLRRLPAEFLAWEEIMDHLNPLIMTCKLRQKVDQLQLIPVDNLNSKAEERRAFVVLTFIAHGYMYGVPNADPILCILPRSVAIPWFTLASNLNINPVVSYSTTALWNWYLIDPDMPIDLRYNRLLNTVI
jgi:indoleamine 2,3-dioxygenase